MKDEDIIELINKSIKKDEYAFKELIHLIQPEMYKIAKIKLKKEEYIYDAIQETIILIYKHLKKLLKQICNSSGYYEKFMQAMRKLRPII